MTSAASAAPSGFHILMPPGWRRVTVDDAGKKELIADVSARMRELGRPDLDAQARTLIEGQWRQLVLTKTNAVYLPGAQDEQTPLPLSIAVKQYSAPLASSFETSIRALAGTEVEEVHGPYGTILRWTKGQSGVDDLAEVRSQVVGYGFPLPGDNPQRGLLFLASIPYLVDTSAEMVEGLVALADTIMETFRWR